MKNTYPFISFQSDEHYGQSCPIGRFLQRVKRFSVEMLLEGQSHWVHSNNSGRMLGLLRKNAPMIASPANNPKRKLQWTQEAVWFGDAANGFWVGVNTSIPNKMIEAAFHTGALHWAKGYTTCAREKTRGTKDKASTAEENKTTKSVISRFDAKLEGPNLPTLWVECKNVTMVEDDVACFPDAITERGAKHLREMMRIVSEGERAAMFYLIQRPDGHCFGPADFVDPAYAALFYEAINVGVEMYAYRGIVTPEGVQLGELVKVNKLGEGEPLF